MKIDIDDEVIKEYNEENRSDRGDQNGDLTPVTLKEMVEEYLADYFS